MGYSTAGLNTGQWYHVAGVADGPNGDMYIYVNGVSVASNTAMAAFTDYNGTNGAYIGNAGDQSPTSDENMGVQSYFFDGVIDEVHVYNRILTEAEIYDLYNNAGYTNPDRFWDEPKNYSRFFPNINNKIYTEKDFTDLINQLNVIEKEILNA